MSGLYAEALRTICGPFIEKPDSIPRAWNEMTPNEQTMTIWFANKHFSAKQLEEVARHAVAQTAERVGHYDLDTANNIFTMFYKDGKH
jgi:hypothetical protein